MVSGKNVTQNWSVEMGSKLDLSPFFLISDILCTRKKRLVSTKVQPICKMGINIEV